MAIGTGTAILGGSILGGAASIIGSGRAADAAERGTELGIGEQRRQFDEILKLLAPQVEFSDDARNVLRQMFGLGGGESDLSPFFTSPGFEFIRDQGLEGIAQTLGAGGQGAFSGNALRAMTEFGTNLASGEFGNFVEQLLRMSGQGIPATQAATGAGLTTGSNISNLLSQGGNIRASGILGQTAGVGNTIRDIMDALILRNRGFFGGGGGGFGGIQPGILPNPASVP